MTYPTDSNNRSAGSFTFGYNAMGQLNTMPGVVDSVTYGPAGELLTISGVYSESRTDNSRLQLTSHPVSGETITYAYDRFNRLISASSNQGWAQGFVYDGFGNFTDKNALAGSVPQLHGGFDATNRQWGLAYDANGNQLSDTTGANTLQYDIENRLIWAQAGASSVGNGYGYDPDNRRVYKSTWIPAGGTWSVGSETIDYFGVTGVKMASYGMNVNGSTMTLLAASYNLYFGGRLVRKGDPYGNWTTVRSDRLGSFGKFYPYGEERGAPPPNDTEKFATYYRDSNTGLDYAVNRYYSAGIARFITPDPYHASGGSADPGSWNRYSYSGADPITFSDPSGLCRIDGVDYPDGKPPCPNVTSITVSGGGGDPVHNLWSMFGSTISSSPLFQQASATSIAAWDDVHGTGSGNFCPPVPKLPSGDARTQLDKNVKEARDYFDLLMKTDPQNAFTGLMGFLTGKFAEGGPWDYKNQYQQNTPQNATARDFGNFNFGAVLEGLGFDYEFTQKAAGAAQILICMKAGSCGDGIPGLVYPYGDQIGDAVVIKKGFDYETARANGCR